MVSLPNIGKAVVNSAEHANKQQMYNELFGVVKETGRSLLSGKEINKFTQPIAKLGKDTFLMSEVKDLAELQMKDPKAFKFITESWGANIQKMINQCGVKQGLKNIENMFPSMKEFFTKSFKWKF